MSDFPTGTVTFLFTDVEGSTRLLERLGKRYRSVQLRHDAVVRAAIEEGDGREVSTEGDSFFAVFATPGGAAHAAVRAQRELAATAWPERAVVRVRMGLHTGEGVLSGETYLGLDVNRAARIAAAAHGGQILISDATRAVVERTLPPATRLRDLGQHRLKDLSERERLVQVVIDGLEQDFPPPRALDVRPHNLPAQLSRFIGRRVETTRIGELLEANRLVTLTGPGGAGKTRLALEVAAEALAGFGDGAWFVDLSPVDDPGLVAEAIAAALRVREQPGRPLIDTLRDELQQKQLLLVLDNFEQVMDAAASAVEPLLHSAPRVKALVTSRVPLHLYGEQQFPVPPLKVPDPEHLPELAALADFEAVALFAERAAACQPSFALNGANAGTVAEITARLDGLPLAIELAASRVKLLPPERLLARLGQRLPLLTGGGQNVPERQRTLRRTIAWSYELLAAAEQQMFARLAVFAGGADLQAVEAVVNPNGELGLDSLDGLAALVDNNLVRSLEDPDGEPRFGMLETIREYALERLADGGQESATRRRHAKYWVEVAEQASEALSGPEQASWTRRLERDHDNFRAALNWALQFGEAELGLRLAVALGDYWRIASHVRDAARWLDELLELPGAAGSTPLRARALTAAGELHQWLAQSEASLRLTEEAVAVYRELGDRSGIAEALPALGWAQLQSGRLEAARANLQEARELNIALDNRQAIGDCTNGLGMLAMLEGRPEQARPLLEEALQTFKQLRNTYWAGLLEFLVGQVDRTEGKLDTAEERFRAGLASFRQLDNLMGVAWALYTFGDLAVARGQYERALRLVGASEALLEQLGVGQMPALATATMGDVGAAARTFLDDAAAGRAYHEGSRMTLDAALAYTLRQEEHAVPERS